MKGWTRPAVAGWRMGAHVRIRGQRGVWTPGTIAAVSTDGDGRAAAVLVAVSPDDRRLVKTTHVEPADDGVYLVGMPVNGQKRQMNTPTEMNNA